MIDSNTVKLLKNARNAFILTKFDCYMLVESKGKDLVYQSIQTGNKTSEPSFSGFTRIEYSNHMPLYYRFVTYCKCFPSKSITRKF
jgi:hypothetical protein